MLIMDIVFPPKNRTALPPAVEKRIPILVGMDVMLILYFVFAGYSRYAGSPSQAGTFFRAVLATTPLFVLSLCLVRFRRYFAASLVGTLTTLLQLSWLTFLLPAEGVSDVYRFMVYLIAASVANNLVSLDRRQHLTFFIAGLAVFAAATFLIFIPTAGGFTTELRTSFVTLLMLDVAVNIALFFTERLGSQLTALAERESEANRQKASSLAALVDDAKGSMQVGRSLLDASEDAIVRGGEIKAALESMKESASGLSSDAAVAEGSNHGILEHAKRTRETAADQKRAIENASSAITEISATIRNIASLARERKQSMDRVLGDVERQGREIAKVVEGFAHIRETSALVLSAAKGILDVSEKTDMLAMNASIEAAHAGSAGKGFSVISGEIRKLSEETRQQTTQISGALGKNEEAVVSASKIAEGFASEISAVISAVKATFDAIDEIIRGLGEISVGTGELASSSEGMVAAAAKADESAAGISDRLRESSSSVSHISDFAAELKAEAERILSDFAVIEEALGKVKAVGERNIREIEAFGGRLGAISSGKGD